MKAILVARYTFQEIIKSSVLVNVLALGSILCLVTYVAYSFTYGDPHRVALNFGLGMSSFSAVGLAIFLGANLIKKEIESRNLYMVLTRSISRTEFILGKILGMSSVILLNTLIMAGMTLILYRLLGGSLSWIHGLTLMAVVAEAVILLLITVAISLLANQSITIVTALSCYWAGHVLQGTTATAIVLKNPELGKVLKALQLILPNLAKINLKDFALFNQAITVQDTFLMSGYVLSYCTMLIILIALIFRQKALD